MLEHGASPPAHGPRRSSRSAWETALPFCGPTSPRPRPRTKPLIPTSVYAITSGTTRSCASSPAPPTASRPSRSASSTSTGPGRRCRTRTPASRRSSRRGFSTGTPRSCSRTGCSRGTSSTSATSSTGSSSPRLREAAGRAINLGTGAPTRPGRRSGAATGLGVDSSRRSRRSIRAGDIRHCYADPTLARGAPRIPLSPLEHGMADLVEWLADQEAEDRVEPPPQSS